LAHRRRTILGGAAMMELFAAVALRHSTDRSSRDRDVTRNAYLIRHIPGTADIAMANVSPPRPP